MLTASTDHSTRRLLTAVEAVGITWLLLLPALRPLVWSGQPTDVANLFYLVLLAAAITTGLLLRGLTEPIAGSLTVWWRRPTVWGVVFVFLAVIGSWLSPLPANAWTLTVGWVLHLAAPLSLWPLIQRHPQVVVAGLVAGLVGEGLFMVGQAFIERPQLAQQLANDPALTVEERVGDQYRARIGSWRLEGTFLLANTLGTYLVLLVPLVWSMACRSWMQGGRQRWLLVAIAVLALVALGMTGSKAAILALLVAVAIAGVCGLVSWRDRLRATGIVGLVMGVLVAAVVLVPALRTALSGSADVRIEYWRAGMNLVAEQPMFGHGLDGFAVQYPRVKSPASEETILAHQETLQAAVDLGVPAALVLLGWWWWVLWSMRPISTTPPISSSRVGLSRTALVLMPLLLLFACAAAGAMSANFDAYPGAVPFLYALLLTVILTWVAREVARMALPSPRACWCAVLACLLHVQADFSLHSMQVVGALAWVVCLGQVLARPSPATHTVAIASPRRQGLFAAAGLLVLAVVTLGVIISAERGQVLERARESEAILARLRLADAGRLTESQHLALMDAFERAIGRVVVEDGHSALTTDPREALAMAMIRRSLEASCRFPADHDLVFVVIALSEHLQALLPARAAVLTAVLEGLVAQWPHDLLVIKALSEHYLRLVRVAKDQDQARLARHAQAFALRAVDLYPTHLPLRQTVMKAAEFTKDQATIDHQKAEIARFTPLVHRDNRAR